MDNKNLGRLKFAFSSFIDPHIMCSLLWLGWFKKLYSTFNIPLSFKMIVLVATKHVGLFEPTPCQSSERRIEFFFLYRKKLFKFLIYLHKLLMEDVFV